MGQRGFQPGVEWRGNASGAPTKKDTVITVLQNHPGISTRQCARLAGVTEKTAAKWRAIMKNENDDSMGQLSLSDYMNELEGSRGETPAPSI